jgi:cytoskeletal protein CcmA (bactofilin family)
MTKWRLGTKDGAEGADIVSLLGEGTTFTGDLVLEGGARIDGKVSGKITTQSLLVIGPTGTIDAQEIHATRVTVCGSVQGNLIVRERLEIQPGGRVQGHVLMEQQGLVVAPGGIFEGVVEYARDAAPTHKHAAAELAVEASV